MHDFHSPFLVPTEASHPSRHSNEVPKRPRYLKQQIGSIEDFGCSPKSAASGIEKTNKITQKNRGALFSRSVNFFWGEYNGVYLDSDNMRGLGAIDHAASDDPGPRLANVDQVCIFLDILVKFLFDRQDLPETTST